MIEILLVLFKIFIAAGVAYIVRLCVDAYIDIKDGINNVK